ncbi:MAG: AAA family ATPase [Candidatus Accumulibacter cognatus]|uniref:AAA family ATPase n=1 Tax=Candidatus Accumulibacter cognatus TaxID=2954383 RepID=A0A7D5SPK2_9PROT|nr:MAG: AAA family ATPase [Candidatus Accumulibacter cognatus]
MMTSIDRARSALWTLDAGTDRDTWVRTAMAAKAAGLDFDAWHEWSAAGGNYRNEADCRSVWQSIKPGAVTDASLFHAARAAGWTDAAEAPAKRMQSHQEGPKQPEASKSPLHDPSALWEADCEPATGAQEYVDRKLGLPDGLRIYRGPLKIDGMACEGALVLPLRTLAGNLVDLQFVILKANILPGKSDKMLLPGVRVSRWPDACLIVGGPIKSDEAVHITEGIGQAWSAHQATRQPAVVAFGVGRMAGVARALRERYPAIRLVLVPDAGKENQCSAIAKNVRGAWVEMPEGSPSNFDLNDFQKAHGLDAVRRLLERCKAPPTRFGLAQRTADRLFIGEPPPVNWLVRRIFPLGVCCLVASPPNVGKSFLSLDLTAKVAGWPGAEPDYAFGAEVAAHGRAVYVSAEDDLPEIHRRLWSLCNGRMPERLHVLSLPDVGHFGIIEADRLTKEYRPTEAWRDLVTEIRELPDVKLIILDTMQALTTGDTNTVDATQPLMNEATALASATGACVLLVHHVAKGSTKEIRTSLDAMEAIRGSGAIAGTARAAYVMWPPADGGREVCDVFGEQYEEGKVAFGIVAKRYGDARRDRTVFVRDVRGILQDRTQQYNALSGTDDSDTLRADLLKAIREKWQEGQSFAASGKADNGLHARRTELPEAFHEKTRAWFDDITGKLVAGGSIRRLSYRGGSRLCPPDATAAVPKPVPETDAESVPTEAEYAEEVAA